MTNMRRRVAAAFFLGVCLLLFSAIGFLQTRQFASILKFAIEKSVPGDTGIRADFKDFSIHVFPPGFSINSPQIRLESRNIARLPGGTTVAAEKIEVQFATLQMLSGKIRADHVRILKGAVRVPFERLPGSSPASTVSASKTPVTPPPAVVSSLHWDRLVELRTRAVELVDTSLRVESLAPAIEAEVVARRLLIAQRPARAGADGKTGVEYGLEMELDSIRGQFPEAWHLPSRIDRVAGEATVQRNQIVVPRLSVIEPGLDLTGKGSVRGDWLLAATDPKKVDLVLDASLRTRTDVSSFLSALGISREELQVSGEVEFDGGLKANLSRFAQSVEGQGKLRWSKARYRDWGAETLDVQGAYKNGELELKQFVAQQPQTPRVGGERPGGGGSLRIQPTRIRLAGLLKSPLKVQAQLEDAHLHWLLGPGARSVWPLDLRVSGSIDADFSPQAKGKWRLDSQLKLKIPRLILDNQRFGRVKPQRKVLDVREIRLEGGVQFDPQALRPQGLVLSLPHSRLEVGGAVQFRTGLDLSVTSRVDLADFDQLSEIPIRGTGTLGARIHGPASRVVIDFDPDLLNAEYLRLKFGALKGRITYDEDPEILTLQNLQLAQGTTRYQGNGRIDFADRERIDIQIRFPGGQVADVNRIFESYTENIGWYPRSLRGDVHGEVQVSGGLSYQSLSVLGKLSGDHWDFFGERFQRVSLTGGLDRASFVLNSAEASKGTGRLQGRIRSEPSGRLNWFLKSEGLHLTDLDTIARLDVPIRGRVELKSEGDGVYGALRAQTEIALGEFSVRGEALESSRLSVRSEGGVTNAIGVALGGQGRVQASYDFEPGGKATVKATARQLDFTPLLVLLNPREVQDTGLSGVFSGEVDLSFRSGDFEHATGRVALEEYRIAKRGLEFSLVEPVRYRVDRGEYDVPMIRLRGPTSEVLFKLRGKEGALDGKLDGKLDLGILEFLTPTVASLSGTAELEAWVTGTVRDPRINGKALIRGANLRVPSLSSPIEAIRGELLLRQDRLLVQDLRGDLASGRVFARGEIELFKDRFPRLDLEGQISGTRLKVYPFQFVRTTGRITVKGSELPYLVQGDIVADSGLSTEKIMGAQGGMVARTARFSPPASFRTDLALPKFKLDLNVEAPSGIRIRNDLFDGEMKGRIKVVNTLEAPRLLGDAEMISGKMVFKDRTFQISSATVSFDNPAVLNPRFSLTAATEVSGARIQLFANGNLENYRIELSSTPSMPESEIISLLAVGFTSDDLSRVRTTDRNVMQQGEAASLVLHSTDFNRDLQSKTGLQVQIDEAINTQVGTSIFKPRSDTDPVSAPKIVIKRQIGERVDVSVGSTVGVGTNSQRQVNAEFRVTPGFSVMGVWDTLESSDAQTQNSYGIDLKVQKRFK